MEHCGIRRDSDELPDLAAPRCSLPLAGRAGPVMTMVMISNSRSCSRGALRARGLIPFPLE
jgi:hypothetical protein